MATFGPVDVVSESAAIIGMPPSNRAVTGRLRYHPDEGISLQCLDQGGLEAILDSASDFSSVVFGQLVNGPLFTLIDALVEAKNFGAGGFADVRIGANQLLVGIHLKDARAKVFDEVRVVLTSLNDWFGKSPIVWTLDQLAAPEVGRQLTIVCKHTPRMAFSPLSGGPSLITDQVITPSVHFPDEASVRNQYELRLIPRQAIALEECVPEIFRLQALLSILCGHQVFCQRVRLYVHGTEGTERAMREVAFMPRFARPRNAAPKKQRDLLFPVTPIQEFFPTIWATWTKRYDMYRTAVELFTSTELFEGQLLNFQLLAIMQALETLHRNRFGGVYTDNPAYEQISRALSNAIPESTSSDLRSALKARIRFGNEYSLRKRLRSMADALPPDIAAELHPNLRDFLNQAVETRNYLTHYTEASQSLAFQDAKLFWATKILRWFFVVVLLRDLGMPDGLLQNGLSRAKDLTHARESLTGRSRVGGGFGIQVEEPTAGVMPSSNSEGPRSTKSQSPTSTECKVADADSCPREPGAPSITSAGEGAALKPRNGAAPKADGEDQQVT